MITIVLIVVAIIIIGVVFAVIADANNRSKMSPDELRAYEARLKENDAVLEWGQINDNLICPHCQFKGKVRVKDVQRKKGISGGKAVGAVITGGVSLLATGISRKENLTQARCDACNSQWDF